MEDFDTLVLEILDRVGHPVDASLRRRIQEQAERQRGYRSPHRYDLERFGLSAARVQADTARFRHRFLSSTAPVAAPGSTA